MKKDEIRRRRLAQLIEEVGSLKEVAKLSGIDEAYMGAILHGYPSKSGTARRITDRMAERITKGTNKPEDWLDKEQTEVDRESLSDAFAPLLAWEHDEELPPGDHVFLPRFKATRLSAGSGYAQVEFEAVRARPQVFDAEWIRSMRLKPKSLVVMYADGNSMEPRIQDADALVVDLSQTDIVDGKVYAIYYSGGERVKRLTRRPGGGLVIASDNEKEHPVLTLDADEAEQVRIIGRVVNTSGHKGL